MLRTSTSRDDAPADAAGEGPMTFVIDRVANSRLVRSDLDYHVVRAAMVIIFL